jgi:hypothetical protein
MAENYSLEEHLRSLIGETVAVPDGSAFFMGTLEYFEPNLDYKINVRGQGGMAWIHFTLNKVDHITSPNDVPYIWLK